MNWESPQLQYVTTEIRRQMAYGSQKTLLFGIMNLWFFTISYVIANNFTVCSFLERYLPNALQSLVIGLIYALSGLFLLLALYACYLYFAYSNAATSAQEWNRIRPAEATGIWAQMGGTERTGNAANNYAEQRSSANNNNNCLPLSSNAQKNVPPLIHHHHHHHAVVNPPSITSSPFHGSPKLSPAFVYPYPVPMNTATPLKTPNAMKPSLSPRLSLPTTTNLYPQKISPRGSASSSSDMAPSPPTSYGHLQGQSPLVTNGSISPMIEAERANHHQPCATNSTPQSSPNVVYPNNALPEEMSRRSSPRLSLQPQHSGTPLSLRMTPDDGSSPRATLLNLAAARQCDLSFGGAQTSNLDQISVLERFADGFVMDGHHVLPKIPQYQSMTLTIGSDKPSSFRDRILDDTTADVLYRHLGITNTIDDWCERLRMWISACILKPDVEWMKRIEDQLGKEALYQAQFSQVQSGVHSLQQQSSSWPSFHQQPAFTFSSCAQGSQQPFLEERIHLERYFGDFGSSRAYVVERIRQLAEGMCMGAYCWNAGGKWKDRAWNPDLPTDAHIIAHLFCTFMDSVMVSDDPAHAHDTFKSKYFITNIDQARSSIAILQKSTNPPHFNMVMDKSEWEIRHGRNNLFSTICLFVFCVQKKYSGFLNQLHLGGRIGLLDVICSNSR